MPLLCLALYTIPSVPRYPEPDDLQIQTERGPQFWFIENCYQGRSLGIQTRKVVGDDGRVDILAERWVDSDD